MRILHALDLDDRASLPALACAQAIARIPARHTLWTLGNAAAPEFLPTPARRVSPRLGRAWLSAPALRGPLRSALRSHDVLVAWSPDALAALHAAIAPRSAPLVGVFTSPPPLAGRHQSASSWIRRAALARAVVLCFSPTAAAGWAAAGAGDVRTAPAHVSGRLASPASRASVRAELEIADDEHVMALLADPPSLGDARRFAYLAGLLGVGGVRTVGVIHSASAQVRRALRYHRECQRAWRMIVIDGPLASVLPGCDAAMIDTVVLPTHPLRPLATTGPAPLTADALAAPLALAAGVPLVVPRSTLADDLLGAGHAPVVAAGDTALALASAGFALYDRRPVPTPGPTPTGPDAIGTLHELLKERLNAPLPGFPLRPANPVPARPEPFPA
jgi:hypothetical protein